MVDGIRTGDPRGFNKGRSSKFRVCSRVRQTPEEGRMTYRPKRCSNNNKDKDNSPKTPNNKNHQALFQKFRQLILFTNGQFFKGRRYVSRSAKGFFLNIMCPLLFERRWELLSIHPLSLDMKRNYLALYTKGLILLIHNLLYNFKRK